MILSILKDFEDLFTETSDSFKSSLIIILILCIILPIFGSLFKKRDPLKEPKGIALLCEILINWVNGTVKELIGSKWKRFAPWITTIAIFIFISNIAGMFGLTSPTANVFITLALGLISGFYIQFAGIKYQGFKNYIKSTFLEPSPIMLPLNIISEVLTPFSLALRLFGNIMSGSVIMGLIYGAILGFLSEVSPILGVGVAAVVTPVFHAIFDIFFGAIQTFVFMLLTTVFISGKLPDEELSVEN